MAGRVFGIAGAVLGALVLAAVVIVLAFGKTYRMPSSSMEPTLHCARPAPGCEAGSSDRFVVLRFLPWGRRDIVAFHTPPAAAERCGAGGTFLKRVIGLPGERISERGGVFAVDGQRLDEPYIHPDRRDDSPPRSWSVPAGAYFLVGDNRSQSCDSRVFGSVPKRDIVGRIALVYWPPHRLGFR